MCYSGPGYTKPTHGYGTPFGGLDAVLDGGPEDAPEDENWAGEGFDKPYQESAE